jgi:hypothetical protein
MMIRDIAVSDNGFYVAVQSTTNSTSGVYAFLFNGSRWQFLVNEGAARGVAVMENQNGTWVAFADCEGGLYLIHDGKLAWHRKRNCYWDVAFWKGNLYGAFQGVDVYSLNGTLVSSPLHGVGILTLIPTERGILAINGDSYPEEEKTVVYLISSESRVQKIFSVNQEPITDPVSHAQVDVRGGKLLLGTWKKEESSIYLIPMENNG